MTVLSKEKRLKLMPIFAEIMLMPSVDKLTHLERYVMFNSLAIGALESEWCDKDLEARQSQPEYWVSEISSLKAEMTEHEPETVEMDDILAELKEANERLRLMKIELKDSDDALNAFASESNLNI